MFITPFTNTASACNSSNAEGVPYGCLGSLVRSGSLDTITFTDTNKFGVSEGPNKGGALAFAGGLHLSQHISVQREGCLSFSTIRGGLLEGFSQLKLNFIGLQGGRCLHSVSRAFQGEGNGGFNGIAHLTHYQTHTESLHELIKVLAVSHVVSTEDLVSHGEDKLGVGTDERDQGNTPHTQNH